jgi:hypothetical protein
MNLTSIRRALKVRGLTPATLVPEASGGRVEEATIRLARLVEGDHLRAIPVGLPEPWPGSLAYLDGVQRSEVVGYVFNRNRSVAVPFIQFFDELGGGPLTLRYAEIATIKFTGKDTAAGNSWKAWVERREREKAGAVAPSGAPIRAADPDLHRG